MDDLHSTFNLEPSRDSLEDGGRRSCRHSCTRILCYLCSLVPRFCRRAATAFAREARRYWQYRRRMSKQVRHEMSVALRSAFVYLLMTVPLLSVHFHLRMPVAFIKIYHWLPFWYVFLLTPYFGTFIDVAWHSVLGCVIGISGVCALNVLMPGGAGHYQVGIYSRAFTIFFAVAFAYGVFICRWSLDGKQYALAVFSVLLVDYMDPDHDAYDFRRPFSWHGPVMCQLYIVLLAVPLAFITTRPWLPCLCRKGRHKAHRCEFLATRDLANLATDTVLCLERLLTYYREDALNFDVESSCFYIRQLGARRTEIETNLQRAWWETCCSRRAHARLRYLHKISDVLRSLRQTLRIQADQLRITSTGQRKEVPIFRQTSAKEFVQTESTPAKTAATGAGKIAPHLDTFVEACKEALAAIASSSVDAIVSGTAPLQSDVMSAVSSAEQALLAALLELHGDEEDADCPEMVFVDGLRTWPALLGRFAAQSCSPEDERMCSRWNLWDWSPHHALISREQHLFALRNCIAWTLALLWSVCIRGYKSGCVLTVSVIFSRTLGSLTHRNFNRMIGMALGIYVGSLPQELLMGQHSSAAGPTQRFFWRWPEGPLSYLIAMFVIWTIAVYGSIATGGKMSYACVVWAGFGGCQMLEQWKFLHPVSWHAKPEISIHTDIMDNFAGCLIIFASDIFFTYLVGIAAEQVTEELPKCLRDTSSLVEGLMDQSVSCEVEGDALQKRIKVIRTWDEEVQKEDPIWSALCKAPYKSHFINAMLDYCDNVYVASQAIHWSARRCSSKEVASKILLSVLDETLIARIKSYAKYTAAALLRTERQYNAVVDISMLKQASVPMQHRKNSSPSFTPVAGSTNILTYIGSEQAREAQNSFLADVLSKIRIVNMDHLTAQCDIVTLRAAESAAAFSLQSSVWALRAALLRIEVLLREEAFWAEELPKKHGKRKIVVPWVPHGSMIRQVTGQFAP